MSSSAHLRGPKDSHQRWSRLTGSGHRVSRLYVTDAAGLGVSQQLDEDDLEELRLAVTEKLNTFRSDFAKSMQSIGESATEAMRALTVSMPKMPVLPRISLPAGHLQLMKGASEKLSLIEKLQTDYLSLRSTLPSVPEEIASSATAGLSEAWLKVRQQLDRCWGLLGEARSEEDFQSVGLLSREVTITLAQAVYDPQQHPPTDDVVPSSSDAKRMLAAFFAASLQGSKNSHARKISGGAFDLANAVQHDRNATYLQAAMCATATAALVSLVAVVAGVDGFSF